MVHPPPPRNVSLITGVACIIVRKFLGEQGLTETLKAFDREIQDKAFPLGDGNAINKVEIPSLNDLVLNATKYVAAPIKAARSTATKSSSSPKSQPQPASKSEPDESDSDSEDEFECLWSGCRVICSSVDELYEHVCDSHIGRVTSGGVAFACEWKGCSYTSASKKRDHITSHVAIHAKRVTYKCDFCSKGFARKTDKKKHMRGVHSSGTGKAGAQASQDNPLKRKVEQEDSSTQAKKQKGQFIPLPEEAMDSKDSSSLASTSSSSESQSEDATNSSANPAKESTTPTSDSSDNDSESSSSLSEDTSREASVAATEHKAGLQVHLDDDQLASISSGTIQGDKNTSPEFFPSEDTPQDRQPAKSTPKVKKHTGAQPTPLAQMSAAMTPDSHVSNAYKSYQYADRAYQDLSITRGKGFTKEKNKKKRGSYRGGAIDTSGGKAFKFDD